MKNRLIEVEKAETEGVKAKVYLDYFQAAGWGMTFGMFLLYLTFQGLKCIIIILTFNGFCNWNLDLSIEQRSIRIKGWRNEVTHKQDAFYILSNLEFLAMKMCTVGFGS